MTQARQIQAEWQRNARLRAGVWAILAILWFYGLLHLQDLVTERSRELVAIDKRIGRTQVLADQSSWTKRAADALVQRQQLEEKLLWREPTQGLAQASFQDWLGQLVLQVGLTKSQVSVAAQEVPKGEGATQGAPLWKASARLSFDFNPRTFNALLGKLSQHPQHLTIETINVRSMTPPRVEMLLVAHFSTPVK